jgi:hypothetical protein
VDVGNVDVRPVAVAPLHTGPLPRIRRVLEVR